MRRSIVILTTFAALVFAVPALQAQEAVQATPTESSEVSQVFLDFVDALKTGNVQVLKGLLSEEMYVSIVSCWRRTKTILASWKAITRVQRSN